MSATCTYVKGLTPSSLQTNIKEKMNDGYRLVSVNFAEGEWVAWLAIDDSDIATGSELTELGSTLQSLLTLVESQILPELRERQ